MTTAAGNSEAPDAAAIISLLTERLYDTGDDMPEIKPDGSILMLINRFSPALRHRVFNFLGTCIHEDLINMKVLVLKNPSEPNRFLALVGTITTIRAINRGAENSETRSAAGDLLSAYRELWMQERDEELTEEALKELISIHLASVIKAGFTFGLELVDHLPSNPNFFTDIEYVVPSLTALVETFGTSVYDRERVSDAIELAAYIHERPTEAPRVAAFIRSHKVFNRALMDDLLASPRTPVEEGVL